jgi:LDH2 family malate/lactate/ureidoglycolate dehydrogenase
MSVIKRLPLNKLVSFGSAFLRKRGVPPRTADYLSKFVMETEAFRSTTHGLVQLFQMHKLLGKEIDPARDPAIVKDKGAVVILDGERTLGILCMKAAAEICMRKARKSGVAFAGIRNTSWVGSLGAHLVPIAEKGFLAQAWAQSSNCKDSAPIGGIDARFSTNPVAVAFPAPGVPVLADFSTASLSWASVNALINKKEKTGVPRFLDNKGRPSKDPNVFNHGGSIMFSGLDLEGHKFYGLSLFNEALTVLAGGSANNFRLPQRQNAGLMVLDPGLFGTRKYYQKEMKRFVRHVKSSRVRPGFEAVRLPGERGFAALDDARKRGLPLDGAKLGMIEKIASENGLKKPF